MRTRYLSIIMLTPSLMAAANECTLTYTEDVKELRIAGDTTELDPVGTYGFPEIKIQTKNNKIILSKINLPAEAVLTVVGGQLQFEIDSTDPL
ncbi:MAG: hypothetical protein LBE97_00375, partial [Holosporales bacterium]|nr:hypothetical protein [Holosporales bacterium]